MDDFTERNAEMLRLYEAGGITYHALGERYGGLSRTRVMQIVFKGKRLRKQAEQAAKAMADIAKAQALWELLVHNRRVIHDELRVAFHEAGKTWKQKPRTIALMDLQPAPPPPDPDPEKEQRRLLNLQQKVKAQERKKERAAWAAMRQAQWDAEASERIRKAAVRRLSDRWRNGPPPQPDWEIAGRKLVREMQSHFNEGCQHWPLVQLEPGDLAVRDYLARKMVRYVLGTGARCVLPE